MMAVEPQCWKAIVTTRHARNVLPRRASAISAQPPSGPVWRWLPRVSAGLLAAALAGCGLDDALHRMDLATDQRQCSEFGFAPGTTAFAQCMEQQAAQRAEENQRMLDRAHRDEAAEKLRKK